MPIPIRHRRNKNKKITSSTHLDEFEDDLEHDLTSEVAGTSDSGGLDGSTTITTTQAAPAVALPTAATPTSMDLVTPVPVMSSATTAMTIASATIATAPQVAVISTSLDTGTESIMRTWSDLDRLLGYTQEPYSGDNPSQCPLGTDFQSMDPNFMDLDLSRIDYSDSSFVPFDGGSNDLPDLQGEAWNSALDPLSEEEMLYYLSMFNQPDKQEGREGEEGIQDDHTFQDPSVMDVGSISTRNADSIAVLDPPATNMREEEDMAVALRSTDLDEEGNDNVPHRQPATNQENGRPPRQQKALPTWDLESEAEDEDDTPQEQTIADKENTRPSRGRRAPMTWDLGGDAEEMETVLRSIDLGPNFSWCVDKWKDFEMCTTVHEVSLALNDFERAD